MKEILHGILMLIIALCLIASLFIMASSNSLYTRELANFAAIGFALSFIGFATIKTR